VERRVRFEINGGIMKVHELKTDPEVFAMTFCGSKNFEIRKNDRDFKVGDTLLLRETVFSGDEMKEGRRLEYTGRVLTRMVNYILPGGNYGLDSEWVIMDVVKI
jgi:hypothetical protein